MIKYVAIYLRLSRDKKETIDVLSKHRDTLVDICNQNMWNYKIYEEIESGERISYRPVMQELLEDVENGMYDAVLVMDIDRLGRGNNKDWGIIYDSFCNDEFNTLIITPQKTYDLTDDADEMMVDFQAIVAKQEYKAIKRRFRRGKIAGAKQGKWVCGKPPMPYITKNKKLEVDQDKLKLYRMLVDKCIKGDSIEEITQYLNNNRIPTPSNRVFDGKNGGWSSQNIVKLLTNEIHLGYMIYGKTKGDTRKNNFSKVNKQDWIKIPNCHEPVKTLEEHQQIIAQIESRRTIPVAARRRKHVLSGLLYCGKCGYRMQFKMSGSGYYCAICNHKFRDGSRCDNRGIKLDDEFFDKIYTAVFMISEERINELRRLSQEQFEIEDLIENNRRELLKVESALKKIFELYEEGELKKQEFLERKNTRTKQKEDIEQTILELQSKIKPAMSDKDWLETIEFARQQWLNSTTVEMKNKILCSIASRIDYFRLPDGDCEVYVTYAA